MRMNTNQYNRSLQLPVVKFISTQVTKESSGKGKRNRIVVYIRWTRDEKRPLDYESNEKQNKTGVN